MTTANAWRLAGATIELQRVLADSGSPEDLAELERVNARAVWGFADQPATALAYVRRVAAELVNVPA